VRTIMTTNVVPLPLSNHSPNLLSLLQIANSSFPTGAFNHSYGFETWIDDGSVANGPSFEEACRDWLIYGLDRCDGAAAALAYRAAIANDIDALIWLDHRVAAIKLARETREASAKTGRALLAAFRDIFEIDALSPFFAAIEDGRCEGHQATIFGIGAAALDIGEQDAVMAFLQTGLSNLVGVASRIIPLGQVESQRIILNAAPLLVEATDLARSTAVDELSSSTVALDIAGMHHERLYSRLCMS